MPGLGVSAFTYRHQLPTLCEAGYRALAVDLKGHGFSDKPIGRREYAFGAMIAHVEDVVDALAMNRRVVLVGQSMSGPLAIHFAKAHTDLVGALILIGSVGLGEIPLASAAPLVSPRLVDPIAPYLVRRWLVRAGLNLVYGDPRRLTDDVVDEYWAPAQFPEFAYAMRALIHAFPWMPLPDAALRQLDERSLIVIGARDRVVRHAESRVARLTGPTVVVVEDAGHAVNEERPEVVNEVILEFLRRHGV